MARPDQRSTANASDNPDLDPNRGPQESPTPSTMPHVSKSGDYSRNGRTPEPTGIVAQPRWPLDRRIAAQRHEEREAAWNRPTHTQPDGNGKQEATPITVDLTPDGRVVTSNGRPPRDTIAFTARDGTARLHTPTTSPTTGPTCGAKYPTC